MEAFYEFKKSRPPKIEQMANQKLLHFLNMTIFSPLRTSSSFLGSFGSLNQFCVLFPLKGHRTHFWRTSQLEKCSTAPSHSPWNTHIQNRLSGTCQHKWVLYAMTNITLRFTQLTWIVLKAKLFLFCEMIISQNTAKMHLKYIAYAIFKMSEIAKWMSLYKQRVWGMGTRDVTL